jgi:hypothetical protein
MRHYTKLLRFEMLEERQVLSALGLTPACRSLPSIQAVAEIHSSRFLYNHSASLSAILSTNQGNDDVEASISYSTSRDITGTTLTIDGHGFYPGDDDVFLAVNGTNTSVHVVPDDNGEIHVTFAANPTGDQQQLPENFPQLSRGDAISLWEISGTLKRGSVPMSKVSATLSDATNSDLSGVATYTTKTIDGEQHGTFAVQISGAAPNTTITIMSQQRLLTTVTTDINGNGGVYLSSDAGTLPSNFPFILASGEPIEVGSAFGTLADVPSYRFGNGSRF